MPWDLDALMVGVDAHGFVKVKTPFKRPKTRVQVDGFYALCGDVVPLPSSGSVLPGWWCVWGKRMWCLV